MYDDENYDDGFDEETLAARFNIDLWKKLFVYAKKYPKILQKCQKKNTPENSAKMPQKCRIYCGKAVFFCAGAPVAVTNGLKVQSWSLRQRLLQSLTYFQNPHPHLPRDVFVILIRIPSFINKTIKFFRK